MYRRFNLGRVAALALMALAAVPGFRAGFAADAADSVAQQAALTEDGRKTLEALRLVKLADAKTYEAGDYVVGLAQIMALFAGDTMPGSPEAKLLEKISGKVTWVYQQAQSLHLTPEFFLKGTEHKAGEGFNPAELSKFTGFGMERVHYMYVDTLFNVSTEQMMSDLKMVLTPDERARFHLDNTVRGIYDVLKRIAEHTDNAAFKAEFARYTPDIESRLKEYAALTRQKSDLLGARPLEEIGPHTPNLPPQGVVEQMLKDMPPDKRKRWEEFLNHLQQNPPVVSEGEEI